MKANELMNGDWVTVHHPTMPAENIQISADWIKTIEQINNGLIKEDSPLFRIVKPIPLTKEILEKNGFVYDDLPMSQYFEQYGLQLYRGGNGFRINCGINVSLIIDSVHQLQHALKLCGIEKEITI